MYGKGKDTKQVSGHDRVKGKAVPLQASSRPEGSRKLRFPDYMRTVQDGGKVVSLTHRLPLPPGNAPGTHFCLRLSRPQGRSAIGRIMSMKNSYDTICMTGYNLKFLTFISQRSTSCFHASAYRSVILLIHHISSSQVVFNMFKLQKLAVRYSYTGNFVKDNSFLHYW
jgi:hypothetical protein